LNNGVGSFDQVDKGSRDPTISAGDLAEFRDREDGYRSPLFPTIADPLLGSS